MATANEYDFDESLGEWDGDEYRGWTFHFYDSDEVIVLEEFPDISQKSKYIINKTDTNINYSDTIINKIDSIINKTDANND